MLKKALAIELKHESEGTRKLIERIPAEKFDFKPHKKSMALKTLAQHVVTLPDFIETVVDKDEIDFGKMEWSPPEVKSTDDLLKIFDESLKKALEKLEGADESKFMDMWTASMEGKVIFSIPRISAIRNMTLNHLYHHRGQLTVYLRLLDVPIPGIYGPSADEQ